MVPLSPGDAELDRVIRSRIHASIHNLVEAAQLIERQGIKGDTDGTLKDLLCGIVRIIDSGINDILNEISLIRESEVKSHRSNRIHRVLEEYHNLIDLIEFNTPQIPLELNYLERCILHCLNQDEMKVVLISGASLSTANLSEGLKRMFSDLFTDVVDFLTNTFAFYWIVYVPPSLIATPLNWALITHEVGHMMEKQKWGIVKKYYGYPPIWASAYQPLVEKDIKSRYAQEFQADYVAVSCFGTAFSSKLLAIYYTREIMISATHPSWKERFAVLAYRLEQVGFKSQASELKKVGGDEQPLISHESIERLNDILKETDDKLKDTRSVLKCQPNEIQKAKDRLSQFAPYTEDVRTLLCAADDALSNVLSSVPPTISTREIERDFNYLIADSIRLSYIRQVSYPAFNSGNVG